MVRSCLLRKPKEEKIEEKKEEFLLSKEYRKKFLEICRTVPKTVDKNVDKDTRSIFIQETSGEMRSQKLLESKEIIDAIDELVLQLEKKSFSDYQTDKLKRILPDFEKLTVMEGLKKLFFSVFDPNKTISPNKQKLIHFKSLGLTELVSEIKKFVIENDLVSKEGEISKGNMAFLFNKTHPEIENSINNKKGGLHPTYRVRVLAQDLLMAIFKRIADEAVDKEEKGLKQKELEKEKENIKQAQEALLHQISTQATRVDVRKLLLHSEQREAMTEEQYLELIRQIQSFPRKNDPNSNIEGEESNESIGFHLRFFPEYVSPAEGNDYEFVRNVFATPLQIIADIFEDAVFGPKIMKEYTDWIHFSQNFEREILENPIKSGEKVVQMGLLYPEKFKFSDLEGMKKQFEVEKKLYKEYQKAIRVNEYLKKVDYTHLPFEPAEYEDEKKGIRNDENGNCFSRIDIIHRKKSIGKVMEIFMMQMFHEACLRFGWEVMDAGIYFDESRYTKTDCFVKIPLERKHKDDEKRFCVVALDFTTQSSEEQKQEGKRDLKSYKTEYFSKDGKTKVEIPRIVIRIEPGIIEKCLEVLKESFEESAQSEPKIFDDMIQGIKTLNHTTVYRNVLKNLAMPSEKKSQYLIKAFYAQVLDAVMESSGKGQGVFTSGEFGITSPSRLEETVTEEVIHKKPLVFPKSEQIEERIKEKPLVFPKPQKVEEADYLKFVVFKDSDINRKNNAREFIVRSLNLEPEHEEISKLKEVIEIEENIPELGYFYLPQNTLLKRIEELIFTPEILRNTNTFPEFEEKLKQAIQKGNIEQASIIQNPTEFRKIYSRKNLEACFRSEKEKLEAIIEGLYINTFLLRDTFIPLESEFQKILDDMGGGDMEEVDRNIEEDFIIESEIAKRMKENGTLKKEKLSELRKEVSAQVYQPLIQIPNFYTENESEVTKKTMKDVIIAFLAKRFHEEGVINAENRSRVYLNSILYDAGAGADMFICFMDSEKPEIILTPISITTEKEEKGKMMIRETNSKNLECYFGVSHEDSIAPKVRKIHISETLIKNIYQKLLEALKNAKGAEISYEEIYNQAYQELSRSQQRKSSNLKEIEEKILRVYHKIR